MMRLISKGFTLIEVLIAMTLLSVMVVLLFSSLRTAAQSWNAGENKIAQVNEKAVVYQFLKRHLSTIRPVPVLRAEDEAETESSQVFQGLPQSLTFVAALPASSARKGLQIFNIAPDPTQPSRLMVAVTPYRVSDSGPAVDRPEVLLQGIERYQFSYFGKTEDDEVAIWRSEWQVAEGLPSLIKVSIVLQDGSVWPDMIFAPKITQAANPETVAEENADDESGSADAP